tara:strand:+ start:781 stop:1005 length:225 start_codon:yes stop_codon:yes gene_type:complete
MSWRSIAKMIENNTYSDGKTVDLIGFIEKQGFALKRNGGNHDIFSKGRITVAVPRHRNIGKGLIIKILKEAKII